MFICSLLSSHSNERSSMLLPLLLLVYFMYYILSTVCMYVEIPVCFLYCFGWGCRTNLCIAPWSLSGDLWTSTETIKKQKKSSRTFLQKPAAVVLYKYICHGRHDHYRQRRRRSLRRINESAANIKNSENPCHFIRAGGSFCFPALMPVSIYRTFPFPYVPK